MADTNDGKLAYRSDAYVDPETGLYTVPEPKPGEGDFTEVATDDGKALWVPVPKWKPCRRIQFARPQSYLDVVESMAHVHRIIQEATKVDTSVGAWFAFIDPTYGTQLTVPASMLCENVAWVIEAWVDIEAVKLQQQQMQYQKDMARMQMLQQKRGKH